MKPSLFRVLVAGPVLLAAGGLVTAPAPLRAQARDQKPATIAILNFTSAAMVRPEQYAALSDGIPLILQTELAMSPAMQVVEREQLLKVLDELKLQKTSAVDPTSVVQAGKLLGAQYFLLGGFVIDPSNTMQLTARAVSIETSRIVYTASVQGKGGDVFKLVAELARKLSTGLQLTPPRVGARPRETGTRSLDALVLYSRAIGEKERGNRAGAVTLARQALELYPDFAEAKAMVAGLGGDQ
jgi:TolB-like protein